MLYDASTGGLDSTTNCRITMWTKMQSNVAGNGWTVTVTVRELSCERGHDFFLICLYRCCQFSPSQNAGILTVDSFSGVPSSITLDHYDFHYFFQTDSLTYSDFATNGRTPVLTLGLVGVKPTSSLNTANWSPWPVLNTTVGGDASVLTRAYTLSSLAAQSFSIGTCDTSGDGCYGLMVNEGTMFQHRLFFNLSIFSPLADFLLRLGACGSDHSRCHDAACSNNHRADSNHHHHLAAYLLGSSNSNCNSNAVRYTFIYSGTVLFTTSHHNSCTATSHHTAASSAASYFTPAACCHDPISYHPSSDSFKLSQHSRACADVRLCGKSLGKHRQRHHHRTASQPLVACVRQRLADRVSKHLRVARVLRAASHQR